jgi:hypothetical protein
MSSKQYLEEHNVSQILTQAIKNLIANEPEQPHQFLADYFRSQSTKGMNFMEAYQNARKLLWNGQTRDDRKYAPTSRKPTAVNKLHDSRVHDQDRQGVLVGDFTINTQKYNISRVVSTFVSSTFTDTQWERDVLVEDVYPFVQRYAASKGMEFIPSEMRWGIRDSSTAQHLTSTICMAEMERTQLSPGNLNYILILGDKYGYRPFPALIPLSEFNAMIDKMNPADRELALAWFHEDTNHVPPRVVLRPTTHAPAKSWWDIFERLQVALRRASSLSLSTERAMLYSISVTHDEVLHGLFKSEEQTSKALVFHKSFAPPLNGGNDANIARNYTDMIDAKFDGNARSMLDGLKDEVSQRVPPERYVEKELTWGPGVNPELSEHRRWLEEFCDRVCDEIMQAIDMGSKQREALDADVLFTEALHHHELTRTKIQGIQGRDKILDQIYQHFPQELSQPSTPLVLFGHSGCGKTSVMAVAANELKTRWPDSVIIVRFLGTTAASTSGLSLLTNLCDTLAAVYPQDTPRQLPALTVFALRDELLFRFAWATAEKPLFLFLDSLDQLLSTSVSSMGWIPMKLPPNVRLVTSTLPDQEDRHCLSYLEGRLNSQQFIEVGPIPAQTIDKVVDTKLTSSNRCLTSTQMTALIACVAANPLGLYMSLCIDLASSWNSWTEPIIPSNVVGLIQQLFKDLEVTHGKALVAHALGTLTVAADVLGITATHMGDLLSLNDALLKDVLQYWKSPVLRVPPLLWPRLRSDLGHYLVERGSYNLSVYGWYHRQFWQEARVHYVGEDQKQTCHLAVAELLSGDYGSRFVERKITPVFGEFQGAFDECEWPSTIESAPPLRRHALVAWVYHAVQAGEVDHVMERIIRMDWLYLFVHAHSVSELIRLLQWVSSQIQVDPKFKLSLQALQLIIAALALQRVSIDRHPLRIYAGIRACCRSVKQPSIKLLCDPSNWKALQPTLKAEKRISPHFSVPLWQTTPDQVGGEIIYKLHHNDLVK